MQGDFRYQQMPLLAITVPPYIWLLASEIRQCVKCVMFDNRLLNDVHWHILLPFEYLNATIIQVMCKHINRRHFPAGKHLVRAA